MFERLRKYIRSQPEPGPEHQQRLAKLAQITGVSIDNAFLFERALRHRSKLADDTFKASDSYERLEFLGDAILDLIVSEIIFDQFPDKNEGFLTKLRAKLVKGEALASYARKLNLSDLIIIGERAQGQGIEFSKSALADVFESIIGAIYIDKGYHHAANFMGRVIEQYVDFDDLINTLDNYKSLLLEYAQAHKLGIPRYKVLNETGPGHNKTFEVCTVIDDKEMGTGIGKSKKEAEQKAARVTLEQLKKS